MHQLNVFPHHFVIPSNVQKGLMICGHFCNMSTIYPYPVPCHVICLFITKKTDSYVMKRINQVKYAHVTVVTFWKYKQNGLNVIFIAFNRNKKTVNYF